MRHFKAAYFFNNLSKTAYHDHRQNTMRFVSFKHTGFIGSRCSVASNDNINDPFSNHFMDHISFETILMTNISLTYETGLLIVPLLKSNALLNVAYPWAIAASIDAIQLHPYCKDSIFMRESVNES
jgi:hypothetical protein